MVTYETQLFLIMLNYVKGIVLIVPEFFYVKTIGDCKIHTYVRHMTSMKKINNMYINSLYHLTY